MAKVLAAESQEVIAGNMLARTIEYTDIVLFRNSAGVVHALLDCCSHADVKLSEGNYDGAEVVECTAHGAQFNICSGKALCMPAISPVQPFPCEERDGKIYVEL